MSTTYPHIDAAWETAFVFRCRSNDVPGRTIGAALAEVDSHLAESGETAADAFGDPQDYADSLNPTARHANLTPVIVGGLLGLVAITALPQAIVGLVHGTPATYTVGQVVLLGILIVATIALGLLAGRAFRAAGSMKLLTIAVGVLAAIGVMVGVLLIAPMALQLNALLVAVVGGAALIASSALNWFGAKPDEIASPFQTQASGTGTRVATALLWPVATAAFTAMALLTAG